MLMLYILHSKNARRRAVVTSSWESAEALLGTAPDGIHRRTADTEAMWENPHEVFECNTDSVLAVWVKLAGRTRLEVVTD
jgi:hypothetical protein